MTGSRRSLRVAVTGGLACGKSTVLAVFAARGAGTIDADAIARDLLGCGSLLVPRVVELLGPTVERPDGSLDRARIANIVFADADKLRALEAVVHPEVIRIEEAQAARFEAAGHQLVIADIPLLFEAGQAGRFDRVVVVHCTVAQQIARAVARGMLKADARRRIAAQMPLADKVARADFAISTDGSLATTEARAEATYAALVREAAAAARPV